MIRVALWVASRMRLRAFSNILYLRRWNRLWRRERFLWVDCRFCRLASRLLRHCTVAFNSRPLTNTAVTPSVAAIKVLTPKSTPITGVSRGGATGGSASILTTGNSQAIKTLLYSRRTSMIHPGKVMPSGMVTTSFPALPFGKISLLPSRFAA